MAQARDELFLKLALRQGLFSQQEAVQFLHRYRDEGAAGEGIGHWLVAEGVLAEEQAEVIREAIANRADGHVADVRRRVPKARAGAQGSGRVAKAHLDHGHHGAHAHHRHAHGPQGVAATPAQQAIYIGSGILAVGLVIFVIFKFQDSAPEIGASSAAPPPPPKAATSEELANRLTGGEAAATPAPATVEWSAEEIARMKTRLGDAIALARSHMGDGRPGRGLETLRKRASELGEILPPEIQTQIDEEITELQKVVDETYADGLGQLKAAKGKGDAGGIEKALLAIEESCGAEYVVKAKKAVE